MFNDGDDDVPCSAGSAAPQQFRGKGAMCCTLKGSDLCGLPAPGELRTTCGIRTGPFQAPVAVVARRPKGCVAERGLLKNPHATPEKPKCPSRSATRSPLLCRTSCFERTFCSAVGSLSKEPYTIPLHVLRCPKILSGTRYPCSE